MSLTEQILTVVHQGHVLAQGFAKTTQKTPASDLELAIKRKREIE